MINENIQYDKSIWALFVILITILGLYNIIGTGFVTNDDMTIELIYHGIYGTPYEYLLNFAEQQGRIGALFTGWLTFTPYLLKQEWYYQLIKIVSLLLPAITSSILIYFIYKNKYMMILNYVFVLSFLNIYWHHHLSTAYVFSFQFFLSLFFITSILIIKFFETRNRVYIFSAYIIYFYILFAYEMFTLYWIFIVILLYHNTKGRSFIKHAIISLVPVLLFLIIYLYWKTIFPSSYSGNKIYIGELNDVFRVIYRYAISAFPGYIYLNNMGSFDFYVNNLTEDTRSFKSILANMQPLWLVKAILVSFISYIALKNINISSYSKKTGKKFLIIMIAMIFLSTFLYGLTKMKQDWVKGGDYAFVATYFSYVWMTMFFVVLLSYMKKRKLFVLIISVIIAYLSLVVDYSNNLVSIDQKLSYQKWTMFDKFTKTDFFRSLPDDTVFKADTLWNARGIAASQGSYWTAYTKLIHEKNIKFLQNPMDYDYELVMKEYDFSREKYFLILNKSKNKLYIYYDGDNINSFIRVRTKKSYARVQLDNQEFLSDSSGILGFNVSLVKAKRNNEVIKLSTNDQFITKDILLDFTRNNKETLLQDYVFSKGLHFWEGKKGSFGWTNGSSIIKLFNPYASSKDYRLSFSTHSLIDRELSIVLGSRILNNTSMKALKPYNITFDITLKPGYTFISLKTDKEGVPPGGEDVRKLAFSISNLNFKLLK